MRMLFVLLVSALSACATTPAVKPDLALLQQQVTAAERAFAKTMADRDHAAFTAHLDEETLFYKGEGLWLRGKDAVAEAWKRFYLKPEAPFSWEPTDVQVLESGRLAHSSGPVRDASGKIVSSFNSIWRLQAPGQWRILFDRGCDDACPCKE